MLRAAAAGRTVGVRSVPVGIFENGASRDPQLRVHSEENIMILFPENNRYSERDYWLEFIDPKESWSP